MKINDMTMVKDTILKNVLAKVILNSCEGVANNATSVKITENILDGLGINSRKIEAGLESVDESNVVATSLITAVDNAASKIIGKYYGKEVAEDEVYECIVKGYESEEAPNVLADTITEILNNAVTSMQTDIKTVSKMVLQLIKENQETEKEEKETELDDFDNPDMENANEDGTSDDEGDKNPFADDGDEKNEDKPADDEPKADDKKDEGTSEDKEPKEEPKDDDKDNKDNSESATTDGKTEDLEENPFESMTAKNIDVIAKHWNNGYDVRAFEGLTCKDITNFSAFCAKEHLGEKLSKSYGAMQGMEDEDFNKNVKDFRTVARTYGEVTVTTLLTLGKLGIDGNNNCIKYPQAYIED